MRRAVVFPKFEAVVLGELESGEKHTQELAEASRRERCAPPTRSTGRITAAVAHRLKMMAKAGKIRCVGTRIGTVSQFLPSARCSRLKLNRVTFWSLP
jgi:hypothetical protein